ncbi:MAG: hypothetical protein ABI581_16690, partial [Sediminibacterium sp.]
MRIAGPWLMDFPRAIFWQQLLTIVGCAWCTVCTIVFLISPEFANVLNAWIYDTPMALFDMTLGFWLVFKGLGKTGVT